MKFYRNSALLLGAACLASLVSNFASANASGHELIVRYKPNRYAPRIVKLSFKSSEEAEAARAELSRSDEVLNVTPNFLYRPAFHLRVRAVGENASHLNEEFLPEAKPATSIAGDIPDVQLPMPQGKGDDPLASQDWSLTSIAMPSVLTLKKEKFSPIIAAVIDTGVDYNHEDLVNAMDRPLSDPHLVGYDFAHDSPKPYDVAHFDIAGCMADQACKMGVNTELFLTNPGHGTHCAGHVGAMADNAVGIRGIGGPLTSIMALKFFYDFGEPNAGNGDDAAAIKAIDYAIANGVKVISASWGGRESRADGEASELKNAMIRAQQAGLIVVVAAGNDSIDQDSADQPDYPAAYNLDNMIVVAATDNRDQIADFSNFGATSVQIGAPGVKILSTTAGNGYNDVVAQYTDSQGRAQEIDWDGTSMATPIVAGAVALVWSKYPTADYHTIRDRILNTARPAAGLSGKVSTGGILNVTAALGLN